jgi:purine-binding chemotaxis protein CheW
METREELMTTNQTYCTFRVASLYFGVEVHRVQEVVRCQRITRVPLAPNVIGGLMNLRGQIVASLDLRYRLGLPDRNENDEPMHVVIRTGDGAISLLVDEIGDVLEVNPETFEQPPETLRGPSRELIRGAHKLDGRLLLVLDIERALYVAA